MRKTLAFAVCCILFGSVAQAPAQPPTELRGSKNMTVAINGVKVEGLRSMTELSGLQKEPDLVEQRQDGNTIVKKLPGRAKAGTLVLTRAMTNDESLREWHKNIVSGRKDRRSVDITVYSMDGQPLRTYHFTNCWPVRYSRPNFSTQKAGMEKIELAYESLQVK